MAFVTEFIQSIQTIPQAIVAAALILGLAWAFVTMWKSGDSG